MQIKRKQARLIIEELSSYISGLDKYTHNTVEFIPSLIANDPKRAIEDKLEEIETDISALLRLIDLRAHIQEKLKEAGDDDYDPYKQNSKLNELNAKKNILLSKMFQDYKEPNIDNSEYNKSNPFSVYDSKEESGSNSANNKPLVKLGKIEEVENYVKQLSPENEAFHSPFIFKFRNLIVDILKSKYTSVIDEINKIEEEYENKRNNLVIEIDDDVVEILSHIGILKDE